MIQHQGTGTPPDADTAEQPRHPRYGEFAYEVTVTDRGAHRAPMTETEVTS